METFCAMALRPFLLLMALLIAWPIKRSVELHMKEGRLKRLLLLRSDRAT